MLYTGQLYWDIFAKFLEADHEQIVNRMATSLASAFSGRHSEQIDAWRAQLPILSCVITELIQEYPAAAHWGLALEYPLLRLQKRIDAILITPALILALEFKVNSKEYGASGRRQVEDYALDLREFHAASHDAAIAPVLVATAGKDAAGPPVLSPGPRDVWPVSLANDRNLADTVKHLIAAAPVGGRIIEPETWIGAPYKPTPSILEAARALYAGHSVREMTYATSDIHNISSTIDAIQQSVLRAQAQQQHVVCFVTGTPGSGKTLVGLNAVHDPRILGLGCQAAYLSGNRPLVEVLREALVEDERQRSRRTVEACRREVQSKVQPLMGYLEDYIDLKPDTEPPESIVVFDEAQRAWDAEFGLKRFKRRASEPALFLEIMARNGGWAVIVALVGNGQEINKGEGGLAEWGRAIGNWAVDNPERPWRVALSPDALGSTGALSELWSGSFATNVRVDEDRRLHLVASARSHRFAAIHEWVDAVLLGDPDRAAAIAQRARQFPMRLTRSLDRAKHWLWNETRGDRRCGIVASSGAKRLRADGLGVALRSNHLTETAQWYLKPQGDIRSSFALEVTASEYTCQGLELDLVGLCWGGDLLWDPAALIWITSKLSGTRWQAVRNSLEKQYLFNKYRVLLTRARQETVIWVPEGDPQDPTREPEGLNATAAFLHAAGAKWL